MSQHRPSRLSIHSGDITWPPDRELNANIPLMLLILTPSVWIVWSVIGIIAGYMSWRLLEPVTTMLVDMPVGIVSALASGWAYTRVAGSDDTDIYVSLLVSAAVSGIVLWLLYLVRRRRIHSDGQN